MWIRIVLSETVVFFWLLVRLDFSCNAVWLRYSLFLKLFIYFFIFIFHSFSVHWSMFLWTLCNLSRCPWCSRGFFLFGEFGQEGYLGEIMWACCRALSNRDYMRHATRWVRLGKHPGKTYDRKMKILHENLCKHKSTWWKNDHRVIEGRYGVVAIWLQQLCQFRGLLILKLEAYGLLEGSTCPPSSLARLMREEFKVCGSTSGAVVICNFLKKKRKDPIRVEGEV